MNLCFKNYQKKLLIAFVIQCPIVMYVAIKNFTHILSPYNSDQNNFQKYLWMLVFFSFKETDKPTGFQVYQLLSYADSILSESVSGFIHVHNVAFLILNDLTNALFNCKRSVPQPNSIPNGHLISPSQRLSGCSLIKEEYIAMGTKTHILDHVCIHG